RPREEKINTELEQLPRPGETVKTGQLILVVVAKAGEPGDEAPKSLIQDSESDDTEKIEEMISAKHPKTRPATNAKTERKKADTTRDVIANTSTSSNSSTDTDKDKKDEKPEPPAGDRKPAETQAAPSPRPATT